MRLLSAFAFLLSVLLPFPLAAADTDGKMVLVKIEKSPMSLGSEGAEVIMVIFIDYECPYCLHWHRDNFQKLVETYVTSGKLKIHLRHLPLPFHTGAREKAIAVACGGTNAASWRLHTRLAETYTRFSGVDHMLKDLYELASTTQVAFATCVVHQQAIEKIERDEKDAAALGIEGTPTFIVGTEQEGFLRGEIIVGARPYDDFKAVIEAYLAVTR